MKIRNGFVSNSSSSSFIMLGVKVSDENSKLFAELYKKDRKIRCNEFNGGEIIGYNLAQWDQESCYSNYEITQLQIEETMGKLNDLGFKDTDIRMYCGVTSS